MVADGGSGGGFDAFFSFFCRILVWGGVLASTFAMPDSTFEGYQYAARVFSAFFILLQLVILLDFIYQINEWLLERITVHSRS